MMSASAIYVSSISILEIAIKTKLGKLELGIDIEDLSHITAKTGFLELPVTFKHAAHVYQFSNKHRDSFDRILLAKAITEPLRFLTADTKLKELSELAGLA